MRLEFTDLSGFFFFNYHSTEMTVCNSYRVYISLSQGHDRWITGEWQFIDLPRSFTPSLLCRCVYATIGKVSQVWNKALIIEILLYFKRSFEIFNKFTDLESFFFQRIWNATKCKGVGYFRPGIPPTSIFSWHNEIGVTLL